MRWIRGHAPSAFFALLFVSPPHACEESLSRREQTQRTCRYSRPDVRLVANCVSGSARKQLSLTVPSFSPDSSPSPVRSTLFSLSTDDMLELLEARHDWATFAFTWELFYDVFTRFLPDVIMHTSAQDESQIRDHYDR